MAISILKRVTLIGLSDQKSGVLAALQDLGILHLIDLTPISSPTALADPFRDTRLALQYLEDCPQKQRPARHLSRFNPLQQVERILKLKTDITTLKDERERLIHQLDELSVWGDFHVPSPTELGGLELFFYSLNYRQYQLLMKSDYAFIRIKTAANLYYVVVIHESSPDLPFIPISLPKDSLEKIKERLEDIEDDLENLETRRIGATRFIQALRNHLIGALNATELEEANHKTYEEGSLFALQGWCPEDRMIDISALAQQLTIGLVIQDPQIEDKPPTCFKNPESLAPGETLVQIYGTPSYRSWDPSPLVYVSFVLFFGMIMADAGYGLILSIICLFLHNKLPKHIWRFSSPCQSVQLSMEF